MQPIAIQSALKAAGHYTGNLDGIFGLRSRAAVDAALKEAGVPFTTWPYSRRMVAIRQWVLLRAGFDPGPFDGVEGPKTIAAMNAYLAFKKTDPVWHVGAQGIALIHSFETCKLEAYPDPGSKDGKPITIGWGSTRDRNGKTIALGARWTQSEADAQFECDIQKYATEVANVIGDAPTTQNQFDALVSFHYNTGAIATATLTKKHKAGDYEGAAAEFARWNKNDGRVMAGLTRRRAAEAALYRG